MSQFKGLLSATGLGSIQNLIVIAADPVPDAVNWTNVGQLSVPITTIGQQITGINGTITLKLNVSGGNSVSTASYGINSTNTTPGTFTDLNVQASPFLGDTDTFTVSNNDWLFFQFQRYTICSETTISVINVSDSNTVLDTFTIIFYNRSTGTCP